MSSEHEPQEEFSFKDYFIPFTTIKAIHWIVVIGLVIYANFLFNTFVWDDVVFIQNNPQVHSVNLIQLFSKNLFNDGGYYRPIPAVYFAVLYSLFQSQPFYYHLIQIILHITVTCLLFLLFKKFFKKRLSFILSLIFLIHPIQVESVGFIGASQSELYALFGFIALLLSGNIKTFRKVFFIGFFLLLALLSKETALAFLLLALLWQILYNREKIKLFLIIDATVILVYSFIRFGFARVFLEKTTDNLIDRLPLWERLLNIPAIIWYYLKTFLFPQDLAILQQWTITKITPTNFYLPLVFDVIFLILFLILSGYVFKYKKHLIKTYIFFTVWFFFGMVFILQIFPLDQTVADRWFYFPIVGLLGIIGVALDVFKINLKNRMVLILMVLIISLLSIRTFIRSFDWRNEMTLDIHDTTISTNSWALDNDLATQYSKEGQYKVAKMYEERSIQIDPNDVNYANLGILDADMGDYRQAKQAYLKSTGLGNYYQTYENLAYLDTVYGNSKKNISYITNTALKKFPQDAILWLSLAILEYNQGNKNSSRMDIAQAYRYNKSPQIISAYDAIMDGKLKKITVVIRK